MTFFSPSVTPYAILATIGWLGGLGLIVWDLTLVSNDVGHLGLALCGAAGVLQIRGMFYRLECREEALFRLGRESGLRRVD